MKRAVLNQALIDLDQLTKFEMAKIKRNQKFVCERCHKPVVFKYGTRKKAHFAHVKTRIGRTSQESVAHKLVKEAIAKWLRHQGMSATVEQRFPVIDRIADVYFEYKGSGYVVEIQNSPMSETEFKKRICDYERLGIELIWIFLGTVKKQESTYYLPPVMQGRPLDRLIHFCKSQAHLTIFESPVYVSTKAIYSRAKCGKLSHFGVQALLEKKRPGVYLDRQWLDIKQHFRQCGWFLASKSEKKLVEQCWLRGFNLAQVPSEVGWPVPGKGIDKQLFVWQAYVLVSIMKFLKVGAVFNVRDVMAMLQREYEITPTSGAKLQVRLYLMWLVKLEIIKDEQGYFEYIKKPKMMANMEDCLHQDEGLIKRVKRWESLDQAKK